jgi:hypothetical protein
MVVQLTKRAFAFALKIRPDAFAADSYHLARFQREELA